ncbi:hypothetical protein GN160_00120 [Blochmannia endosymbiont of Colobopsis nipponica]|uniref:hypothetical protein n=1 Tax=Blochmannia endosymbiont of Colobopsis nipponica TaxID=2681987 RepID=UPI00178092C4|nr:hypothetical protein [Blochmannia endosymbiont of Colobopsis nipponica]QOI11033.1 hypothetical protein GN160_00120 [Blochmannia endosymbiont of Colobopsis nipponica]
MVRYLSNLLNQYISEHGVQEVYEVIRFFNVYILSKHIQSLGINVSKSYHLI